MKSDHRSINRVWLLVFLVAATGARVSLGQSSNAAIEQYNLAARYQDLEQFDLAAKEWLKLTSDHKDDPLAAAGRHYAGVCQFRLGAYPKAIATFEEFLAKHPKHELTEATLTNLGLAAYNQAQQASGDTGAKLYEQSIAAFDKLRKQFPESKLAARSDFYRAEALYALGQLSKAEQAYAEWLNQHEENSLSPEVQLALGVAQTELAKAPAAIATLEKLLASNPADAIAARAAVRLGDAQVVAKKYAEAANSYARAIDIGGDFADVDYAAKAQVSALFNAGDFVAAAQGYEQLGDIGAAGKALHQSGDYAGAAERLAKAYQAAPNDAELAHWWVRSLLQAGRADEALKAAEVALAKISSPNLLLDKADAMYSIDASRAASLEAYITAAQSAEGELAAEARHLAAATALELGDYASAKQQAETILKKYGESSFAVDGRLTLAEAQLQSGDAAAAVKTFKALLEAAEPEQRDEWSVRLAWAQSTAGDEAGVAETLATLKLPADSPLGEQANFLLGRSQFRSGKFAAAIKSLRSVATSDPPGPWSPEAMLIMARSEMATGDPAAAIGTLTALLVSKPKPQLAAQAHYRRAEAHQQAGNTVAALDDFRKVAADWPDHPLAPYAHYRFAIAVMKEGQLEAAAERFAKLVELYPNHALAGEAQLAWASCLTRTGKHKEALEVLGAMDASDPRVAMARGASLAGEKKLDEAIAAFKSATAAEGDFADRDRAWYELGWTLRESGKLDDARQAFNKLADEFADSSLAADARFRVGELQYDANEFEQAADSFRQAADAATTDKSLAEKSMHMSGWSLNKANKSAEAAEAFSAQLKAYPEGPLAADAKWMQGEVYFATEKYAEALAAYEAAATAKPTAESLAPLGMLHAGQAAGQEEKWQVAIDWLKRATAEYPDYEGRSEVDYELGWALSKQGNADQAKPLLAKVADSDTSPLGARARFVVGELQFADKQYEEAVRTFFKVAYGYGDRQAPEGYHPWQSESLFEAARCLEQLDRSKASAKLYQELVERFPNQPKASLAKKRLEDLNP